MELLRGGSGHSHSISASRLGGLSGQNATVAPIIFALLLNATVAPILSGRPALPLLGVCGHHRSPELINTLAAGRAAHPSPASTRVSDYSLTTPFVFHLWLSFILSCIPTAAAQAALFGPGCRRAACASVGVCSRSSGAAMVAGRAGGWLL